MEHRDEKKISDAHLANNGSSTGDAKAGVKAKDLPAENVNGTTGGGSGGGASGAGKVKGRAKEGKHRGKAKGKGGDDGGSKRHQQHRQQQHQHQQSPHPPTPQAQHQSQQTQLQTRGFKASAASSTHSRQSSSTAATATTNNTPQHHHGPPPSNDGTPTSNHSGFRRSPSTGVINGTPTGFNDGNRNSSDDVQELKSYSRIIQSQNARLAELERVNDDLERRLEIQAKQKMTLESELTAMERQWSMRYSELETERDAWKGAVEAERRRSSGLRDQISRKDRELHRMLQRKYDGGRDIRAGSQMGSNPPPVLSGKISPDPKLYPRQPHSSHNSHKRRDSKSPLDLLAETEGGGENQEAKRGSLGGLFDFFGM
ncbi:hypothetical protein TrRE_jg11946 [Triparma retinervis]|uniref:Uncharacterized protein n=1 Tax=Triparma retinervis TaxID=2557542 RepID=A0A9W7L7T1_9STRA|nr:hypothetical protein TrRE_jg11946 [Triparma retinervis]